jgi:hypothetical protein
MSSDPINELMDMQVGHGPMVAVAVHDGHAVRQEVAGLLAISDSDRRREEDACSSDWTFIAPTRVEVLRSRFEVDLNRPRHRAVYQTPQDAWGLRVWKRPPSEALVQRSLDLYDMFYHRMFDLFTEIERRHDWFFVYDLHCYNHRRDGSMAEPSDPVDNPQINICTGGMDLERCEPVVRCFEDTMKQFDFPGGPLDVRRNVRFRATRFSRWVHENFPGSGISIGIEVKKFFMNEWTHEVDDTLKDAIGEALQSTVIPIQEMIQTLGERTRI